MIFEFSGQFLENAKVKNFLTKFRWWAEFFYAGGQTDVSKVILIL